jgi:hypothetical protein
LMFRVSAAYLYKASTTEGLFTPEQLRTLVSVMTRGGSEGVEVAWIFQGAGSLIFCLLLLRSHYVPAALARLGILGAAFLIPMAAVMFVFPQYIGPLKLVGLPGFFTDVVTAIWLLAKGLRPREAATTARPRTR